MPLSLSDLELPIVLAPLGGGPATPALTAAVSEAGGLGFLAAGYRTPDAVRADITELWEYGAAEVHRYLERGDEVLEVRTTPMRARASGVQFSEPVAQRYRFEGGRVIRMTLLTDVDRAIADFEAGRPPHPPAE